MELKTWLEINEVSVKEFAKRIGKNQSLVHKYVYGDVIPKHEILVKIYKETFGAVTANDFHRLSEQLLLPDHKRDDNSEKSLHANSFK